jgi:hypothetical protein
VKKEYPTMDQAVAQHYAREITVPGSTTLPRTFVEAARNWLYQPLALPQHVIQLAAGKRRRTCEWCHGEQTDDTAGELNTATAV